MSPEPLGAFVADPGNPQSWNAYSYVGNNPLRYSDPTGYEPCVDGVDPDNGNLCTVATSTPIEPDPGPSITCYLYPWLCSGQSNPSTDPQQPPVQPPPLTKITTIAPGPPTPWYKTCTAQALFSGAGRIAIDAIGLIPEAEGFTKVFENTAGYQIARAVGNNAGYRGVVATQYGMTVVAPVKGAGAMISGAFGLGDTSVEGRISTGLTVASFIPGVGTAAAAGSIGVDGYKAWKAISQCP